MWQLSKLIKHNWTSVNPHASLSKLSFLLTPSCPLVKLTLTDFVSSNYYPFTPTTMNTPLDETLQILSDMAMYEWSQSLLMFGVWVSTTVLNPSYIFFLEAPSPLEHQLILTPQPATEHYSKHPIFNVPNADLRQPRFYSSWLGWVSRPCQYV